jgi:hypothetical protein
MTIDQIRDAVEEQGFGLLPREDADRALLAHGGITPEDVKRVTVTFNTDDGRPGVNISFEV